MSTVTHTPLVIGDRCTLRPEWCVGPDGRLHPSPLYLVVDAIPGDSSVTIATRLLGGVVREWRMARFQLMAT